jgi:hypothetical protein
MARYAPNPGRVSEFLAKLDLEKHNSDQENAGYRSTQWVPDEYGNPTVKVEWFMGAKPDVGNGRKYEGRVAAARRAKLRELMVELQDFGYNVVWGWDPDNGDPDTNFIVVISPESAQKDAEAEEVEAEPEDPDTRLTRLESTLVIALEQAEEASREIARAHASGKDEVARRLEHQLMRAVLIAIVSGSEDAVDLSAAALASQHLFFAR